MRSIWRRIQFAPKRYRWPIKWLIFLLVLFFVLYPNPARFVRHVRHVQQLDSLADPENPLLSPMLNRFNAFLSISDVDNDDAEEIAKVAEEFVNQEISYGWDWEVWNVADYVPDVGEVIDRGREDCDGRAVLAAALLRAKGIDARLVGDPRHMWVRTPFGDIMNPLGPAVFQADAEGMHVRWSKLFDAGPLAFGISVFPLGRELIILLTVWLLLMGPDLSWPRSLLALWVLFEGLIIIRLAGSDYLEPRYGAIAWGGLHVLAAWIIMRKRGPKRNKYQPVGMYL